jgi:adenylate cyclase
VTGPDVTGTDVTGPDIALRSIMPAFEGVIPATIATAAADGTPNITYISVARFLGEERIAISNQFFGKTTSNLGANPFLAVRRPGRPTSLPG